MRGRNGFAVAVRRQSGAVEVWAEPLRSRWVATVRRIPLLRGIAVLWETLQLGTRALLYSSRVAVADVAGADAPVSEGTPAAVWFALALSLVFAIGLFFLSPVLVTSWLDRWLHNGTLVVFVEGLVRLVLLLGYLALIGRLPDIRRVFQYHGAEHRAINCYEAGQPLEVEHVQRFSLAHPRCGTAFLLVVVVVSILVFTALGPQPLWWRLTSRVVLVPLVAALAYEVIRFEAAHARRTVVRWAMAPNLALQRLTTREPDDEQAAVAIQALRVTLQQDGTREPPAPARSADAKHDADPRRDRPTVLSALALLAALPML